MEDFEKKLETYANGRLRQIKARKAYKSTDALVNAAEEGCFNEIIQFIERAREHDRNSAAKS